jgi:hypothetical protein
MFSLPLLYDVSVLILKWKISYKGLAIARDTKVSILVLIVAGALWWIQVTKHIEFI